MNTTFELKAQVSSEAFKKSTPKFPAEKEELVQLNKTLKAEDNHFVMLVKLKE